jgi:hypothetical protein
VSFVFCESCDVLLCPARCRRTANNGVSTCMFAGRKWWRWRESNRASPFCRTPRQRHLFDSSCDDCGMKKFALVSADTRCSHCLHDGCVRSVSSRCLEVHASETALGGASTEPCLPGWAWRRCRRA